MTKPILGVDLDNVIAQTDPLIRQLIRDRFDIELSQADVREFAYSECGVTRDQEKEVFAVFHKEACLQVSIIEGAQSSLRLLQERYEVHIVTSRPVTSRDNTIEWLERSEIPYDRLEFMKNKADASHWSTLIDDRRETIYELAQLGVRALLWNYPWNQAPSISEGDPKNVYRVNSWTGILELLGF